MTSPTWSTRRLRPPRRDVDLNLVLDLPQALLAAVGLGLSLELLFYFRQKGKPRR